MRSIRSRKKLFLTGTAQLQSLPFSLISLVVASTRLFYSQRLGIFSDHAPCLKMMARALFLNFLLILGPLFTLIIVASYFHLYVMVPVIITWFSNWIIMNQIYCTKSKVALKKKIPIFCKKS